MTNNLTKEQFIEAGAVWWNTQPWLGPKPDMEYCRKVCADYLDDFLVWEKIEYGDPDYDWVADGVEDFFSTMEE